MPSTDLIARIMDGRTDLVFEFVAAGNPATSTDPDGVPLINWCDYYGDVSAIKFLVAAGASLESLGANLSLSRACFHGHWRLCEFLLESGADPNHAPADTGETPLHSAICKAGCLQTNLIVRLLLAHGANPLQATLPDRETGAFMRDCRTKAETALHRAAAFGDEETIQLLLDAGAFIDARDMNGDSPLSWASWYLRPDTILRKLCYGDFRINPAHKGMDANLLGKPSV
jgi:ankyrin repeat protein